MSNNHETRETSHGTLKTCIQHQGSKIDKLINKFTNSPINFQNRARNKNKIMQNKANFKIAQIYTSTCNTNGYGFFHTFFRRKNKAKQTQNKPNFSPKLALFFPNLALFYKEIIAFAKNLNLLAPRSSTSKVGYKSVKSGFKYNFVNPVILRKESQGLSEKNQCQSAIKYYELYSLISRYSVLWPMSSLSARVSICSLKYK